MVLWRDAFTCVGWQVTLCDHIWQVSLRSSVKGFQSTKSYTHYAPLPFLPLLVVVVVVVDAHADQVDLMLREGLFTRGLHHANVSSLLATCLAHTEPPMLIYPHLSEGNLKRFLHRCKISDITLHQVCGSQCCRCSCSSSSSNSSSSSAAVSLVSNVFSNRQLQIAAAVVQQCHWSVMFFSNRQLQIANRGDSGCPEFQLCTKSPLPKWGTSSFEFRIFGRKFSF